MSNHLFDQLHPPAGRCANGSAQARQSQERPNPEPISEVCFAEAQ